MEIKEIDGKKFIEFEEHKHKRKQLILSTLFLVLLGVAIIAMLLAVSTLLKNKDVIQQDPLRYGMDVHGFVSCQCFDEEGRDWQSEGAGFINREARPPYDIGFELNKSYDINFELNKLRVTNGTG